MNNSTLANEHDWFDNAESGSIDELGSMEVLGSRKNSKDGTRLVETLGLIVVSVVGISSGG